MKFVSKIFNPGGYIRSDHAGIPRAMVFYHPKMSEFSALIMIKGIHFAFIAAFISAFNMYLGKFPCF